MKEKHNKNKSNCYIEFTVNEGYDLPSYHSTSQSTTIHLHKPNFPPSQIHTNTITQSKSVGVPSVFPHAYALHYSLKRKKQSKKRFNFQPSHRNGLRCNYISHLTITKNMFLALIFFFRHVVIFMLPLDEESNNKMEI